MVENTAALDQVSANLKLGAPTSSLERIEVDVEKQSKIRIHPAQSRNESNEGIEASTLKRLSNVSLSIAIDDSADLPVIKIFDNESGDEILQVPAEHSLNISRTIKAALGAIFDKEA